MVVRYESPLAGALGNLASSLVSPLPQIVLQRLAALTCCLVALVALSSAGSLRGQGGQAQQGVVKRLAGNGVPTLQSIGQAVLTQDYTVEQLRRFRRADGSVVTVRELLQVQSNNTFQPQSALTFLGVEGEPSGSPLSQEWQQTYARYSSVLVRNGSFQVRDLSRAGNNYTLHDFGQVLRAGRIARRMVVFPNTVDKAIWVVDVDGLTNVPLFVAEFDNQLKLFAEIEAVNFSGGVQNMSPAASMQAVTPVADFAAGSAFLGGPAGLVDPDILAVVADYGLESVEVYQDPLNGREKLVMNYTDGIDQFMVVQTVNVSDPFGSLPGSSANVIGRFRDPALSALVFWDDDVTFHVAGRGALRRLDDVASRIYRQALSQ